MKIRGKIECKGATGYILLWLLGIPIPSSVSVLFCCGGCTWKIREQVAVICLADSRGAGLGSVRQSPAKRPRWLLTLFLIAR